MASSPHEGGTGVEVVVMTVQEAGKEATTPEENNLMEDEGEEDLATPHVEVKPGMGSTSLLSSSLSVESTTTDKIVAVSPDMNGASGEKSVVEETCVKEVVLEQKEVEETLSRRQEQLQKQSRFTKASVIIPPENFAIVEDGLYRSAQPGELNFPFMQRLGLRTIIWLAPEQPQPKFRDFIQQQDIKLHHLGVLSASNAWDPITENIVIEALNLLLIPSHYPMMVMCNLGRHRTGTVIGCLRKLQRWNLASIFEEYRRHAGAKVRLNNEQFIELFDTDQIIIPEEAVKPLESGDTAS